MQKNNDAKKIAIIKSNTTQKVASGNYRGAKWTMWKSRDAMFSAEPFGVEIMLEMGTRKESYIRAAAGKSPEEALQKAKKRADEEIARWDKMHPNDPYKNSLEAKKLAVIKSNAAPEVKLKALEKLNSKETEAIEKYAGMLVDARGMIQQAWQAYSLSVGRNPVDSSLHQKINRSLNNSVKELNAALESSRALSSKYKD